MQQLLGRDVQCGKRSDIMHELCGRHLRFYNGRQRLLQLRRGYVSSIRRIDELRELPDGYFHKHDRRFHVRILRNRDLQRDPWRNGMLKLCSRKVC